MLSALEETLLPELLTLLGPSAGTAACKAALRRHDFDVESAAMELLLVDGG